MEEIIDLLDEKGKVIGEVSKEKAHKSGLFHRVVHVWILNDKNQILVQRRSKAKDFYPNVWDVSFAGHIHAGESSLDAALREGKEELAMVAVDIDIYGNIAYILGEPSHQNGLL